MVGIRSKTVPIRILTLLLITAWFSSTYLIMHYQRSYTFYSHGTTEGEFSPAFNIRLDVEIERTAWGFIKEEIFSWSKLWLYHILFLVGLSILNLSYSLYHKRCNERSVMME